MSTNLSVSLLRISPGRGANAKARLVRGSKGKKSVIFDVEGVNTGRNEGKRVPKPTARRV